MLVSREWHTAMCSEAVWVALLCTHIDGWQTHNTCRTHAIDARATFVALHQSQWWRQFPAATEPLWTKKKHSCKSNVWVRGDKVDTLALQLGVEVTAAALDAELGRRLVTGGQSGTVQVWALQSGALVSLPPGACPQLCIYPYKWLTLCLYLLVKKTNGLTRALQAT